MRRALLIVCCLASLSAHAQFQTAKIYETDLKGIRLTPSIAFSQKNPTNLVVATGIGKVFHSEDAGKTWSEGTLKSEFGFYGNPSLVNAKGEFYLLHATDPEGKGSATPSWLDRIVCHTSSDKGVTWSAGSSAANNPPKDALGPVGTFSVKKGDVFVTWTQFDQYELKDAGCTSNIFLSTSSNGSKWSKPVQINQTPGDCSGEDNSVRGAVCETNYEGKSFMVWAGHELLYLDRSYDGGTTWLSTDLAFGKQVGGWSQVIPGFGKVTHTPSFVIDITRQRTHGSMSVAFADQRNGIDDTDIWYQRSNNHGDNWTAPERINHDPPGKQQFLPAMAIDQYYGIVCIAYYDRRAYNDLQTDVYLAYSKDGGNKFYEMKISDTPFVADENGSLGDGIGIAIHEGVIAIAWTRLDDGKTSVMTAVIKPDQLTK